MIAMLVAVGIISTIASFLAIMPNGGVDIPQYRTQGTKVIFISDKTVWFDAYNHDILGAHVISVIKNPEDLVSKAELFYKTTKSLIKELSFSSHGFKSGVQTELGMQKNSDGTYKDEYQNLYIPYFSKNLIIRLKKVLAKDAIYIS
jgi:hypothetical protein